MFECVCVFFHLLFQGSFLRGGSSRGEEDPEAGGHQVHPQESVRGQREQHRKWDRRTTQVRSWSVTALLLCVLREDSAGAASLTPIHAQMQNSICKGSIERATKCMVSVETVGLCTRDVRSKEDRPIFSVPVARATAHRGGDGDGVWSSPQQCIEERERDIEGGEVERGGRVWWKEEDMGEWVEWSFALKSAFSKKRKSWESKKESKRGILCFCKKSHLLLSDADVLQRWCVQVLSALLQSTERYSTVCQPLRNNKRSNSILFVCAKKKKNTPSSCDNLQSRPLSMVPAADAGHCHPQQGAVSSSKASLRFTREAFPVCLSREPSKHTGLIPIYCSDFRGAEETDERAIWVTQQECHLVTKWQ